MSEPRLRHRLLPARFRERLKDRFLTLQHGLRRHLAGCQTVLDVGCGADSPLQALSGAFSLSVGVDGFRPSLQASRRRGLHHAWVQLDLGRLCDAFPPGSFDAVVALDVIEHFEKPAGERLIADMERLARRKVVLFTPNGFVPQGELEHNPHQVHRSGWSPSELRARGYGVQGVQGLWFLRGEEARVRAGKPGELLSWWSQPLVTDRPQLAFSLLAVRELGER